MQKWGFSANFSTLVHHIDLVLHTMEDLCSPYNLTSKIMSMRGVFVDFFTFDWLEILDIVYSDSSEGI